MQNKSACKLISKLYEDGMYGVTRDIEKSQFYEQELAKLQQEYEELKKQAKLQRLQQQRNTGAPM